MSGLLRVLLVEDNESDAKLVCLALRRTWNPVELERVDTPDAMSAALDAKEWDIVISDWSMPAFSAPAALAILSAKCADIPFVIVSGTIGEETAVEAMRAGANDFVLKDKIHELSSKVARALRENTERMARRQAEDALRRSEVRFRRLAESGVIGILVAEIGGTILDANDAYLKMVGYSRQELVRSEIRWPDLIPPESRSAAARASEQLQATGVAGPWETETFRKDGSRAAMIVGAATLEAPQVIVVAADVTERRRAEEGRARAESALRQSEAQLRQAQKMEAVGRLAGGVAHDFNNILSVILSYAELILTDESIGESLREDVDEINKAAGRAAGLTHQLLMFSRQQVVAPKVVDLHEVLVSMTQMLARILGEDVELVVPRPNAIGKVKVDPSHIEQVILNLVVNARDAMPTGGRLTLETANVELDEEYALGHPPSKSGPHVMLAVSDTGVGIDRDTQARIFEPFFTTKGPKKGTGLGLSTVFGIIQQSGGHVWVSSEVGIGTTFKIYLPRVDSDADVLRPPIAPTTLRGTETILLVEDEHQVRAIVLSILRRQGYHVLYAADGDEAQGLSQSYPEKIHLLLTDAVMPRMSGPELAKRLATARPEMKVLCMSGYTDDSVVRHGVLDSGVAFLQKPLTPHMLASKVREVLDAATPADRRDATLPNHGLRVEAEDCP